MRLQREWWWWQTLGRCGGVGTRRDGYVSGRRARAKLIAGYNFSSLHAWPSHCFKQGAAAADASQRRCYKMRTLLLPAIAGATPLYAVMGVEHPRGLALLLCTVPRRAPMGRRHPDSCSGLTRFQQLSLLPVACRVAGEP